MNSARGLGLTLLPILLAAACGDAATPGPDTPTDQLIVTVETVSSSSDCDPDVDNPGDFSVFIEGFTKPDFATFGPYDRVAASTPQTFSLNASKGDVQSFGVQHSLTVDVPRRDNFSFAATVNVLESDSGTVDARLTDTATYYFDADLDCWYGTERSRCGPQGLVRSRTFREDQFKLFNSDDEGCQITVRWSVEIERG